MAIRIAPIHTESKASIPSVQPPFQATSMLSESGSHGETFPTWQYSRFRRPALVQTPPVRYIPLHQHLGPFGRGSARDRPLRERSPFMQATLAQACNTGLAGRSSATANWRSPAPPPCATPQPGQITLVDQAEKAHLLEHCLAAAVVDAAEFHARESSGHSGRRRASCVCGHCASFLPAARDAARRH